MRATKVCNRCKAEKKVSDFGINRALKSGINNCCKECGRNVGRNNYYRTKGGIKVVPEQKRCARCGEIKLSGNFYKFGGSIDGLSCYCNGCQKKINKLSYAKRRGRPKPFVKRKRCAGCGANKDADCFYRTVGTADGLSVYCRSCFSEISKKWRRNNREKVKLSNQRYHHRYNIIHADRNRAHAREWAKRNTKKRTLIQLRHLSRRRGLPTSFSDADRQDTGEMFGWECAFCGAGCPDPTWEHVVPSSRRDVVNPGTVRGNIIPLCKPCNSSKSDKLLEEYICHEKIVRPEILNYLRSRGISGRELVGEVHFFLHMLGQSAGKD